MVATDVVEAVAVVTGRAGLVLACVVFDLLVLAISVELLAILLIAGGVVVVGIAGWIVDGDHTTVERDR